MASRYRQGRLAGVAAQDDRSIRFEPGPDAPRLARRTLRHQLTERGVDPASELCDDAVLLASELFDNAVLHAGTSFELETRVDPDEVFVGVRDHGAGPLELHLSQPRARYGRAATHGRGLMLVQRMAHTWGTRHDADGSLQVWFVLRRRSPAAGRTPPRPAEPAAAADGSAPLERAWADSDTLRWLLRVPAHPGGRLELPELVAELVRRLRELTGVPGILVEVDDGSGGGFRELARDGVDPAEQPPDRHLDVALPLSPPLRGTLRLATRPDGPHDPDTVAALAEVAAQRLALAVESDWMRAAERRRQTWLAYLADTSELLGQSLDVGLTVAVVPHVAVPRLGNWCAVYLPDAGGQPKLAAVSHADERALAELRAALENHAGQPSAERPRLV